MNELLVNADDFGLHADINRGIAECVAAGTVRGVSVCPVGAAPDWKALARMQASGIHMGAHVTLVGEAWSTDGRLIRDWKAFVRRWLIGGRRFARDVGAEAARQIEECGRQGLDMTHLDSHQHIHLLPGLWRVFADLAGKHGIGRVRVPVVPRWRLIRRAPGGTLLQILGILRRKSEPDHWHCIGLARGGHNTIEILENELSLAGGRNVEFVAHPGIATESLLSKYGDWGYDWTAERDMLVGAGFRDAIARCGYRLS